MVENDRKNQKKSTIYDQEFGNTLPEMGYQSKPLVKAASWIFGRKP